MTSTTVVTVLVRLGLVSLFLPFSALDKVADFGGAVRQAEEMLSWKPLAVTAILCALAIETMMSIGVLTGFADRACALIVAGYCVITAMLWKRFWAQGDFWQGTNSKGRGLFWDFLKNVSLGAGFLLVTIGPDGSGIAPFLAHPFASSHPYAKHGIPS